MLRRFFYFCLSVFALRSLAPFGLSESQIASSPAQENLLVTCAEIRLLKPPEADKRLEARIEAVVTVAPAADVPYTGLVVQDATAGMWVSIADARRRGVWDKSSAAAFRRLAVGDRVRIEGVTERGGFAPVLLPRRLEILSSGEPLPTAINVTLASVRSGKHDVQRVTVAGVVQDSDIGGQNTAEYLVLKIVNSGGHLIVRIPRSSLPPESELLDTQIEVSGTLISRHNSRAEMSGAVLVTDRAEDVRIMRYSMPPQKAPVLSLASLRPYEFGGVSSFRRRISGTVTCWQPGRRMVLQKDSSAVEVTTRSTQTIALGSVVEASGFVSSPDPICRLENAVLRVLGHGESPLPVQITMQELLDASRRRHSTNWQRSVFDYHYRLARLTGTLVETFGVPGRPGRTLLLRSGGSLLPVHWEAAPADFGAEWQPGSELAVTGIVMMEPPEGIIEIYEPSGKGDVTLLLRDAGDVQVLSSASWWTRQRLINVSYAGLALIIIVLLVVWDLSRRVRRQASELAGRIALQHEADIRFQATLEERNRLGADMHDGLQQFLAGLSMQLEAAQGSLEMGRDAAPSLQAARRLLLTLREDFRHCVNALRDTQAEMDIPAILERTSAIIRACHPVEMIVEVHGEPKKLPGNAVANLMLIAQEAASNAVRHGKARRIILRCQFTSDAVTVEVEDDGIGFAASSASTEVAHYGLSNMRDRVGRLGGSLRIESQAGTGTRITARVPLPIPDSAITPANFHPPLS